MLIARVMGKAVVPVSSHSNMLTIGIIAATACILAVMQTYGYVDEAFKEPTEELKVKANRNPKYNPMNREKKSK